MTPTSDILHVALSVSNDDPLEHERITRALRDELLQLHGLKIEWVDRAVTSLPGAKAVSACETVILALSLGRAVLPPLVKVIEAWLKTRADQILVFEHEGSKVALRGSRTSEDIELVRKLLER